MAGARIESLQVNRRQHSVRSRQRAASMVVQPGLSSLLVVRVYMFHDTGIDSIVYITILKVLCSQHAERAFRVASRIDIVAA
jgi:hypothetical protein